MIVLGAVRLDVETVGKVYGGYSLLVFPPHDGEEWSGRVVIAVASEDDGDDINQLRTAAERLTREDALIVVQWPSRDAAPGQALRDIRAVATNWLQRLGLERSPAPP